MARKCNPYSQKNFVIQYLNDNRSITSMEAFYNYGITRLSAIIHNLRKEGYDIKTITRYARSRYSGETCTYAEYRIS